MSDRAVTRNANCLDKATETKLFAPVPCRASIRSEQLIYSSQFHVTSDSLARSFACSTVFQVFILVMADNRVQLLVSQAVPAALSRLWFNELLYFLIPKNLNYRYLFVYLRLLLPSCQRVFSLHSSRLPSLSRPFNAMRFLPRYFVLYLHFVCFSFPCISSLSMLSSQLFAFRTVFLHSLHAYSNVLLM